MADVRSYTDQIAQAAYGREVRTAIVDAINAVSDENNTYNQVKTDIQALNESVQASYNGNQVIDQEIKQTATAFQATATELASNLQEGRTLNDALNDKINNGTTLNTNLVRNTDEAQEVDQSLANNVAAAQTFNQNFDAMVQSAAQVEADLTDQVEQGTQLMPGLQSAVNDATTAKAELDAVLAGTSAAFAQKVDKVEGKGLSANDYTDEDKSKLDGVAAGANQYVHPAYTPHLSGLYKLAVDESGHVAEAQEAVLDDFTAIGLPAQDTTYELASAMAAGLMSELDKAKLDTVEDNANHTIVDSALDSGSSNPVQNSVVTTRISQIEADLSELASNVEQGASGRIELPGGLLVQWGTKSVSSVAASGITTSTVTYPKSFSSAPKVFCVTLGNYHISAIPASNGTAQSFVANLRSVDGNARTNRSFNWLAIGYK